MFLRIVVFYVLTWFFLVFLGGIQQETGVLPPEVGLAQWGPGIAGLLMLALFRRDNHKMVFFSKETPELRYLFAALIPAGAGLIVLAISSLMNIEPSADAPVYGSLLPLLLWMPLGALGEEIGWRGYLHKKLDSRMRGLFSSLLVGVLWMPIHVALLGEGLVFVLFLILLIVSYSIVIYALVHDTGFNILLASLFHLAINLTNLLFLDVIHETPFMMVNAVVWAVTAGIVVYVKREAFFASKS